MYYLINIRGNKMINKEMALMNSKHLSVFNNITKAYYEFTKKKLTGYKFTPNEISTMIYLLENDDIDTAKGISDKFGVTQYLICRSVDSLTKKGFITTEIDPNDRRVNHLKLHITDKKLLDILKSVNSEFMDYMLSGVLEDDSKIFRNVLESVEETIR
jgi:DNA-binding MarR family transcriptional regulator